VAIVLCGATVAAQAAPKAVGHWQGTIHMGANDVPMTIDLSKNSSGAWVGAFSVPGSSQVDVPLGDITADDASVHFTLSVQELATFEGKLSVEGNSIAGTASNSQGSVQFELTRAGEAHVNAPPPSSALPKEFEGRWEGAVDAGGNKLRLAIKLTTGADGNAAGSLISIDQGGQEFPATTVAVEGKKLTVEWRVISGSYSGVLGTNGEIVGEWAQGGAKLALVLKKADDEAKKP
jgi:hypothetical protein